MARAAASARFSKLTYNSSSRRQACAGLTQGALSLVLECASAFQSPRSCDRALSRDWRSLDRTPIDRLDEDAGGKCQDGIVRRCDR